MWENIYAIALIKFISRDQIVHLCESDSKLDCNKFDLYFAEKRVQCELYYYSNIPFDLL